MPGGKSKIRVLGLLALCSCFAVANGQAKAPQPPNHASAESQSTLSLSIGDENGLAVAQAQVTVDQLGQSPLRAATDYLGRSSFVPRQSAAYNVRVDKPGFYESTQRDVDAHQKTLRIVLTREQMVQQQVNVTDSTPGIDTQQISDRSSMN